MSVIRPASNKKEATKLVGALLPLRMNSYLSIYALAKGITKTEVIRQLVEAWITDQRNTISDENLFKEIVERCNRRWHIQKITHPETDFNQFKNELQYELVNKGLSRTYIQLVLVKLCQ